MTTAQAICKIRCGNSVLEQVNTYAYLGSLITMGGECDKELRSRLAKGYAITTQLKKILGNYGIKLAIKVKLLKTSRGDCMDVRAGPRKKQRR